MERYTDIYAGASAKHIAAAVSVGRGALILEPTVHAAGEYIESLRPCPDEPARGRLSGEIRAALDRQGYLRDGRMHPHGAEALLLRALSDSGAQALFLTQVLSVTHGVDGVSVRALCLDTVRTFCCERFHPLPEKPLRSYNVLATLADDFSAREDVRVFSTIYPALKILRFAVDRATEHAQARAIARSLGGARLVHCPSLFCAYDASDPGLLGSLDAGERGGEDA